MRNLARRTHRGSGRHGEPGRPPTEVRHLQERNSATVNEVKGVVAMG